MCLNIRLTILSARIEWHWHHILRSRKKQNELLNKGATFQSTGFLRINSHLDYHSVAVMDLTHRFKELMQPSQNPPVKEKFLLKCYEKAT